MRTVELSIEMPMPVPMDKLFHAVGYLSTWNMSYPKLRIYAEHNTANLMANYFKEDGTCGYTIGAIWDSTCQKYSFNS